LVSIGSVLTEVYRRARTVASRPELADHGGGPSNSAGISTPRRS
jgi:hypothetical protein